nr:1,2-phenylacetyl-CoA epoxidase subunit PaaC [Shimwellia pseudoproteus]
MAFYTRHLGDNSLVLSQRLCAWCGFAPELEIDLALANIGLDLLGQARNLLAYSASLTDSALDEDALAYGRDERQFTNLLLVEQPNGDFSDTLMRQYLMDAWHLPLYQGLVASSDPGLAAIAAKAVKEVRYHLRFSRGWLVRLGNGTALSNQKMQQALDRLWRFSGEMFSSAPEEQALVDQGVIPATQHIEAQWQQEVRQGIADAGLVLPDSAPYRTGGKQGLHTEHLGPLLAEMQYLQRVYPGQQW